MMTIHPPTGVLDAARPPALTRRTSTSFDADNPAAIVPWLTDQGFDALPPRSIHEYQRMRRGLALVVVYHSGSVVVQGSDVPATMQLLSRLEGGQQ